MSDEYLDIPLLLRGNKEEALKDAVKQIAALEAQLAQRDARIAELGRLNAEMSLRMTDKSSALDAALARVRDWDAFFNAFASSRPIWPNDWEQEVAMVAYALHCCGWRPVFDKQTGEWP